MSLISQEKNNIYRSLTDLGDQFSLNISFDRRKLGLYLEEKKEDFHPYNPNKPGYGRYGLSLTSLDGSCDGKDLTSLKELYHDTGVVYHESSFKTPTKHLNDFLEVFPQLESLRPHLGRSHILRFDKGGFFPPHRDLGDSFRIISYLNTDPETIYTTLEDKVIQLQQNRLYFLNTKKTHAVYSFKENTHLLIINGLLNEASYSWVKDNLRAY